MKIETNWNLKLLYKSHSDPQIEKDIKIYEKLHENFAKKYANINFVKDEKSLDIALKNYEGLIADSSGSRAIMYFYYTKDLNANDNVAEGEIAKISDKLTKASNKVLFFELVIGKISVKKQSKYLTSKRLTHYKYFLENVFKRSKHNLTEAEEKIMSLKALPAHQLWTSNQDKLLSKQTIEWEIEGKLLKLPIAEAMSMIPTLKTKDRQKLHILVMEKLKSISDFAEAEINAVYTDKKINDELRGFKNPYDATLLSHETDENMVKALVSAVTEGFTVSHRFYKLKAKLLKQKKLTYADRAAGIGTTNRKISFEEGLKIVRKAFKEMDPEFEEILDRYLKNGQIDVYPKKGKTGGAYCSSGIDIPTFVLLNHIPEMRSVTTLAHEMGHAIHSEYSKKQSPIYQGHSIAVAEVASTFFEEVIFYNILPTLNKKEQIVALHDKINDEISTIFRQIACFNFEKDLHKEIRSKGSVSKEEIGTLMNTHMKSYLGPDVKMTELDGYFFVNWSHIRRFFYVYSYSFGNLVSKSLYGKYREDPSYLDKIKQFLFDGGSKSPHDIFYDIGIDTSDSKFWKDGLKQIERDIERLEKLTI